jgi:DNA-binding response OmpR family regulator
VLQQLRAAPLGERYMIIMLTGRKGEQNIVKALRLGADDYVTKPFSFRELEVRIERLVKRSIQG